MGKKVMFFSIYDYAGSGYRMTEAISLNTYHFVEYSVLCAVPGFTHFKRYPTIYRLPEDGKEYTVTNDDIERINLLLADCDIIHIKSDSLPSNTAFSPFIFPVGVPIIHTVSGTGFRNIEKKRIDEYVKLADFRTALNPDLNYPELKGIYTPFAYDCSGIENKWINRKIPIIAHSPSSRNKKGTKFFLEACKILKARGNKFKTKIIEGLEHKECLIEKSKATIFFDQIGAGSYGNSAVESMSMGIPTVCQIAERSYLQSDGHLDDCPVVNCGTTLESITLTLEETLHSDLDELSARTYEWCRKEHSYESVGKMWGEIYQNVTKTSINENILLSREDIWKQLLDKEWEEYQKTPVGVFSVDGREESEEYGKVIESYNIKSCLDIGCGCLPMPAYMKTSPNVKWSGIDPFEGDRERLFEFKKGCAEDIDYPDETFDGVSFGSTIDHLLDPELALQEAYRVLQRNGYLFIWFRDRGDVIPYKDQGKKKFNKMHLWGFNSKILKELVEKQEFKVESITQMVNQLDSILVAKKGE